MKKRLVSIDLIKAIGLIFMIIVHFVMYLLLPSESSSLLFTIIRYTGQLSAPLFLFAVGLNFTISTNNNNNNKIIYKSIILIAIGLLFINIWSADILHYIGIFMIILYLISSFSNISKIIIITILPLASKFLLTKVDYLSTWSILAYELKDFWTFQGFAKNLILTGFYPIFPWLSFIILGSVIGSYLLASIKNKKEESLSKKLILIGVFLSLLGLILNFTIDKIKFYPASISYVIFYCGMSILLFSIFFYFLDIKSTFKSLNKGITFLGSTTFSIYILHVILGILYFKLTGLRNFMDFKMIFLYTLSVFVLIIIICYPFKKKTGMGPLEYLIKNLIE